MGLFDRSFSLKKEEEFTNEDLDILLKDVEKIIQDIDLSGSGGETESLQENIEKSKLSFLQQFGASKSLTDAFRDAPLVGGGGRFGFTPDFEDDLSEEDLASLEEIRRVYKSGVGRAIYSAADIVASFIDLSGYTNLGEKVDKIYKEADIEDPETAFGQITSLLLEYGVPGAASIKIMQGLSKLPKFYRKIRKIPEPTKVTKPKKITKLAGAMGLGALGLGTADFLAGSREAIDPFESKYLITQRGREDLEGKTGRDLAIAKFKNRLLYAQEGALIGGFFPLGLKVTGKVGGFALKQAVNRTGNVYDFASMLLAKAGDLPGAKQAVRGIKKTTSKIPNINPATRLLQIYANYGTDDLFKTLPPFKLWRKFDINSTDPVKRRLKEIDKYVVLPLPILKKFRLGLDAFRSAGRLTPEEAALKGISERTIKKESKTVTKLLDKIDKVTYKLAEGFAKQADQKLTTPALQEQQLENVLQFLKGQKTLNQLEEVLQAPAKELDEALMAIKKRYAGVLPDGELKDFMLQDLRSYMRKSFAFFTNKYYKPNSEIKDKAIAWVSENVIKKNKDILDDVLNTFPNLSREQAIKESARIRVEAFLTRGNYEGKDPLNALQFLSKKFLRSDDLIRTGDELNVAIKKLLGEETNLRSSVLTTATDMIVQYTKKTMYDELAELGLKQGWLFSGSNGFDKALNAGIPKPTKINKVAGVNEIDTKLVGLFASPETEMVLRTGKNLFDDQVKNDIFLSLLSAKGLTQYGLTVLSPATQVRNVVSASMFALFNGHIGGRASVTNAFKMVIDDIFGGGKIIDEEEFIKRIARKIELGVMDENVVASELRGVLEDIQKNSIRDTKTLLERLGDLNFTKKATELYAGGDNLWKFFGHEFVMSQLKPAIKTFDDVIAYHKDIMKTEFRKTNPFTGAEKTIDDAIEEMAAWSIRNTYPTYSKVPPIIQAIRKLPLGNFVAFPAEIWRTSFNALELAMREISSSNAQIRQMGFRRILGGLTVFGGFGVAAPKIAETVTGISQSFMNNFKRDYGADWERNSNLIPASKMGEGDDKGRFKYINLSYFNPYDVVMAPISRLFEIAFTDESNKPERAKEGVMNDLFNYKTGAITEILKPFLSEAIIVEKILDIAPAGSLGRGGKTKTGTTIYNDTDDLGVAVVKSFGHLIEGIQPGATRTLTRIGRGFGGDKYVNPFSELANLFSGIKVQEGDVLDKLDYVVNDFQKIPRETKVNMSLYNHKNWRDQTPELMGLEYINQQNKAFRDQYKIYQAIETARQAGLSDQDIRAVFKERDISNTRINALMDGRFDPVPIGDGRMKDKIKELENIEKLRGVTIFTPKKNKDYYYPKTLFKDIENKYNELFFDSERSGDILEEIEKGILDFNIDDILEDIDVDAILEEYSQQQEIPTPPLPKTPDPSVAATTKVANVNPQTNLTNAQAALLSPGDQALAQRLNRRV
jgi:hypothetical protein